VVQDAIHAAAIAAPIRKLRLEKFLGYLLMTRCYATTKVVWHVTVAVHLKTKNKGLEASPLRVKYSSKE